MDLGFGLVGRTLGVFAFSFLRRRERSEKGRPALKEWFVCFWTYIAAADACVLDLHDDIMRVFDLRDGPIFEVDLVRFLKHKGRVLRLVNFFRHVCVW